MIQFEKHGKTSNNWSNSGRLSKLSDRDRRSLNCILSKKQQTTATMVCAKLNQHLSNAVSAKTVRRELHKAGYHGRATIRKPLLSSRNVEMWCRDHRTWSPDQWKRIIFSDESSFTFFPTLG